MPDRIDSEHVIDHMDAVTAGTRHGSDDGTDRTDVSYRPAAEKEEYGAVENRGSDMMIEHPVDDVEELFHRAHLQVLLGDSNRDNAAYDTTATGDEPAGTGDTEFDLAVLEFADSVLAAEGESFASLPRPKRHVNALLLYDAHDLSSRQALVDHLTAAPEVARAAGYDSVPGQSQFARVENSLIEAGYRDVIANAATRAVHGAERRGLLVPYDAREAHGLALPPVIDERAVADRTCRVALVNWVEYLLSELLEPVSLGRAGNQTHHVREIVASIAHAALINGLESARKSGAWLFDASEIPSPSTLSRVLGDLEREQILQMFVPVYQRTVEVATELGFFDRAYDYALDPTWVTWGGEESPGDAGMSLINNPDECETGKGWCFTALTVMDLDARFALGVDLAADKGERTGQFRRMLRTAARESGVRRVHIDREFFDGDAVRLCRAVAKRDWVIRAKQLEDGDVAEKIAATPEGESEFYKEVSFADVTPDPNLYVHPVPTELRGENGHTHMAFLTDLTPEDTDLRGLYYRYQSRWSIEVFIRQLKHGFAPQTESPNPNLRLFLFNIATLFYNIHALVNRAPSLRYGLRLDVTYYEVLLAIVTATFTRTGVAKR